MTVGTFPDLTSQGVQIIGHIRAIRARLTPSAPKNKNPNCPAGPASPPRRAARKVSQPAEPASSDAHSSLLIIDTAPSPKSIPPFDDNRNNTSIIMADRGRGGGFGARGGDRGRGRGRGRGRRGGKSEEKEWQPVTKLGRLVKANKINSMEEIYLHSLPIKEFQIVDQFLPKLKDEVMKIKPVQKQTRAGQRTRFKAVVIIGDSEGHVGLGIKTSKEVATAIRAAIIIAKLSVIPVRRGYWGTNLGAPHSLPSKQSGKCGSVTVRLIPAPRGTGLVASPAVKRFLQLAGVEDAYTSSAGSTKTLENTLKACFVAVSNTYGFLTPNLWKETKLIRSPLEEFADTLREKKY
ncbi:40S ribosomal protein [Claviceps maximensis]|nr:40S ribosomal protein [Claviceps maximensis]